MQSKKAPEPATLDQEMKIIELRRAGLTWQVIAEQTGYAGPSGAYKAYQRAAERLVRPKLDEHRDMEIDRLDRLQAAVWAKAANGDFKAIEAVLRITDRRVRILGLEAPKDLNLKAEVTSYDAGTVNEHLAAIVTGLANSSETGSVASDTGEAEPVTD